MSYYLKPINPAPDAPQDPETKKPQHGYFNLMAWLMLIRLLKDWNVDVSEFSDANEGQVISDSTCQKVASAIEQHLPALDNNYREWLEPGIVLWRNSGGYKKSETLTWSPEDGVPPTTKTPEDFPPLRVEPYELRLLDLSTLPHGVRLFVSHAWFETRIIRDIHGLQTTSIIVSEPDETSSQGATASRRGVTWQMSFPEGTSTEELLRIIEAAGAEIRQVPPGITKEIQLSDMAESCHAARPKFPFDPPIMWVDFLARDLSTLPEGVAIRVEGGNQPFGILRNGDSLRLISIQLRNAPTANPKYRGKWIGFDGTDFPKPVWVKSSEDLAKQYPKFDRADPEATPFLMVAVEVKIPASTGPVEAYRVINEHINVVWERAIRALD